MIDIQPILNATEIVGALSPYYVVADDTTVNWNSIELRLYVWQGDMNDVNITAPKKLKKGKLLTTDKMLEIEISDYLVEDINPMIDPFNFQVTFGIGASFFYYELDYLNRFPSGDSIVLKTVKSKLKLATLGWRYSYEENRTVQQFVNGAYMANGWYLPQYSDNNFTYKKDVNYTSYMSNYVFSFKKNFPISDSNDAFLINQYIVEADKIVCGKGSYGVAFINKTGVWDTLPFTGKVQESIQTSSDSYNRGYRSNFKYQPQYQASKTEINKTETLSFTLNTGALNEQLSAYYEELLYSPRLILVDYEKNISYPVKVKGSTFTRKNKNVDKNKINHTIAFEADNNIIKKW